MEINKTHYYAEFKSGYCVMVLASGVDYAKEAAKDFADSFRTKISVFRTARPSDLEGFRGRTYETV